MKDVISVDSLFRELFNRTGVKLTEIGWELAEEEIQETSKALHSLLISKLPEKDTHSHMTRNYCTDCAKRDGTNITIDRMHKSIDEMFGVIHEL